MEVNVEGGELRDTPAEFMIDESWKLKRSVNFALNQGTIPLSNWLMHQNYSPSFLSFQTPN